MIRSSSSESMPGTGRHRVEVPSSQRLIFFIAKLHKPDMAILGELLESEKVRPVIDRRYELCEIADALRYMGEGHAQGKIVITT